MQQSFLFLKPHQNFEKKKNRWIFDCTTLTPNSRIYLNSYCPPNMVATLHPVNNRVCHFEEKTILGKHCFSQRVPKEPSSYWFSLTNRSGEAFVEEVSRKLRPPLLWVVYAQRTCPTSLSSTGKKRHSVRKQLKSSSLPHSGWISNLLHCEASFSGVNMQGALWWSSTQCSVLG